MVWSVREKEFDLVDQTDNSLLALIGYMRILIKNFTHIISTGESTYPVDWQDSDYSIQSI